MPVGVFYVMCNSMLYIQPIVFKLLKMKVYRHGVFLMYRKGVGIVLYLFCFVVFLLLFHTMQLLNDGSPS